MPTFTLTDKELESLRQAIYVTRQLAALLPNEAPMEGTRLIAKASIHAGVLAKLAEKLCIASGASLPLLAALTWDYNRVLFVGTGDEVKEWLKTHPDAHYTRVRNVEEFPDQVAAFKKQGLK